ncbi:MAG: SMP-30/gluconolactonase/LRE family protein [Proteobacteria bacterium]|nr:SMP-30/gluconolactonase/LRE family protein [Pseudomonadota bacterium]
MHPPTAASSLCAALAGSSLACGLALASSPTVIDATAHYPEGPVWHDGRLFYVEYAASTVKSWDGRRASVVWRKEGCGPSGLIARGEHLLVACYDGNYLLELDASGHEVRSLRTDAAQRPFIGPNDFAADDRGGTYFSASGVYDLKAPVSGALLYLGADGTITPVADTLHYPNGLTVSRDRKHLLVAEMLAGRVLSFPIHADGRLGARTVWARLQDLAPMTGHEDAYNGPDGLKLGPDGNYYIAQNGSGRVLVVSDAAKLVRVVSVPTPYVTNMAFDPRTAGALFITGVFDEWKPPFAGAVYHATP